MNLDLFTAPGGIAFRGRITDNVLRVIIHIAGKLADDTVFGGCGYEDQRILYQVKSTLPPDYIPGTIGDYVLGSV